MVHPLSPDTILPKLEGGRAGLANAQAQLGEARSRVQSAQPGWRACAQICQKRKAIWHGSNSRAAGGDRSRWILTGSISIATFIPVLDLMSNWCGREDSNFHGLAATTTSTLRVYQFRHDRTHACIYQAASGARRIGHTP